MSAKNVYKPRDFNLSGLEGISDETIEMHFKLYEGYVKNTNLLKEQIAEIIKDRKVDKEETPAYSELTRRLGFEYNGMVLHEYYFENLKSGRGSGRPDKGSAFMDAVNDSFPDYETWKTDFSTIGTLRGVGWAVCYQDPGTGALSNHWIELHEAGNVAGYVPILIMDVWEHAYLLDYKPSDRPKYIEAFFANIDWDVVSRRTERGRLASTA